MHRHRNIIYKYQNDINKITRALSGQRLRSAKTSRGLAAYVQCRHREQNVTGLRNVGGVGAVVVRHVLVVVVFDPRQIADQSRRTYLERLRQTSLLRRTRTETRPPAAPYMLAAGSHSDEAGKTAARRLMKAVANAGVTTMFRKWALS